MTRVRLALTAAAVLTACGGSRADDIGSSPTPVEPAPSSTPARACVDESGAPAPCAITPTGKACARDQTASCFLLVLEEVTKGREGVCLRLLYENRCAATVYTDTRIEHVSRREKLTWQGWTSTTLPNDKLDVAVCGATGRYLSRSSFSAAEVDVLVTTCPTPP